MATAHEIVILAGGLSHERDVSIRSGRRVAEVLRGVGHQVEVLDVDDSLLPTFTQHRPDLVWPILHGAVGEDGSIRDVLDLLNLSYVGTGAGGSRRAWNKAIAKSMLADAGHATADYTTLPQPLFRDLGARAVLEHVFESLGPDLVVKPAFGGSALGVSEVHNHSELPAAMVGCFSYGDTALIEQYVAGTEVAVSVIEQDGELHTLPIVEIVTEGPYDFDARYNPGRVEYFTPARLDSDTIEAAAELAKAAHRILGLRDISRTDLIITPSGVPTFLEVNVAPGMTETSLFPLAGLASVHSLEHIYSGIVESAFSRQ